MCKRTERKRSLTILLEVIVSGDEQDTYFRDSCRFFSIQFPVCLFQLEVCDKRLDAQSSVEWCFANQLPFCSKTECPDHYENHFGLVVCD